MKNIYNYMILLTVLFISSIFIAPPAYALDFTSTIGTVLHLNDCLFGNDSSFFLRKITCVRFTIIFATQKFLIFFALLMTPFIWIVVTLTVTFFGVRLAIGEGEMNKKAFILLVKIGMVALLGIDMGFGGFTKGLVLNIFDIMDQLQKWVTTPLLLNMIPAKCNFDITTVINSTYNSIIWERLDCILSKLFGFGGANDGKIFFAAAVIGIVSSALFSGTMGVMVFFLGIATLLTVIIFAFRSVWIYVSSYVFVGFLLIMTPLVAPMMLLGVTQNIFWIWLRYLIASMFIPAVLFAYLSLAIPLLDKVMFDTNNDLSIASTLEKNTVNNAHRAKSQKCQWSMPTDEDYYNNINTTGWLNGPIKNILSPMMSGQTDLCALFDFSSLDFGKDHFIKMMKIGYSFFIAVFVAWMLKGLLDSLPQLVSGIFGAYIDFNSPIDNKASSTMGLARNKMMSSIGGNGGASNFVKAMPSAMGIGRRG